MNERGSKGRILVVDDTLATIDMPKSAGCLLKSAAMPGAGTSIGCPSTGESVFLGKLIWPSIWMMIVLFSVPFLVQAARQWHPFPVEVPTTGSISTAEKTVIDYVPLEKAQRRWSLCASFPHIKDSYWLAVNFGLAREVERLGVQMRLYQAGGYDNLPVQIEQIKACVAAGADGVIIGAISYDGLDSLVDELHEQGVPVVDLVNGMSSSKVSARSLVSFEEMGYRAGQYIARLHPKDGKPARVAWFPGPLDAGWVKDGDKGFRRALAESSAEILAVRYGDTGKYVQTALIEEVLDAHVDIDIIAGTAVTAVAAVAAVKVPRIRGLSDRIKVVAYYFTPEVYREIKRGHSWLDKANNECQRIPIRVLAGSRFSMPSSAA